MVLAVGGYKEGVILEDWYMYLKITQSGYSLDSVSDILVGYRRHGGNTSSNYVVMHRERKEILREYSEHPYYRGAVLEYDYTVALDLLPYNKRNDFRGFLRVVVKNPLFIFRTSSLKFLVKLCIGKKRLLARVYGRQ